MKITMIALAVRYACLVIGQEWMNKNRADEK